MNYFLRISTIFTINMWILHIWKLINFKYMCEHVCEFSFKSCVDILVSRNKLLLVKYNKLHEKELEQWVSQDIKSFKIEYVHFKTFI